MNSELPFIGHNKALDFLHFNELPTSIFFSYFSLVLQTVSSSIQEIKITFREKLSEVFHEKFKTHLMAIDNIICATSFMNLQALKFGYDGDSEISEIAAHGIFQQMLPNLYNTSILHCQCKYICKYHYLAKTIYKVLIVLYRCSYLIKK